MNVLIITKGQYPNQHAAAIRYSIIAQGIFENGNNVEFLVLGKQDWKEKSICYNNVNYTSICTYSGENRFLRKLFYALDIQILSRNLKNKAVIKTIDTVLCFTTDISIIEKCLTICNKMNIPVFHERTELPYVFNTTKTWLGRVKYKKYINKLVPRFRGVFVISDKLEKYFLKFNPKVFKILSVVDPAFFARKGESPFKFQYIAYCGTMSGSKDGIPVLIEAFAKLSDIFPEYKLVLIGNNKNKIEIIDTLNSIKKFQIEDKVVFTGFIERDEMPVYLGNAKLLVVSKPNNEQNSGNFPIKVGEYLATGTPVVLTKVGEIHKFLTDGKNAYLAEPDSPDLFFEKMKEALINYDKALNIGRNGKVLAESLFDYKIQSKRMIDAIKETIE